jgi:hypothetical protein
LYFFLEKNDIQILISNEELCYVNPFLYNIKEVKELYEFVYPINRFIEFKNIPGRKKAYNKFVRNNEFIFKNADEKDLKNCYYLHDNYKIINNENLDYEEKFLNKYYNDKNILFNCMYIKDKLVAFSCCEIIENILHYHIAKYDHNFIEIGIGYDTIMIRELYNKYKFNYVNFSNCNDNKNLWYAKSLWKPEKYISIWRINKI